MKYRVHGYCFVPQEAEIIVEAESEDEAIKIAGKAWKKNKCALIVPMSAEENSAFDWQPSAQRLE